MAGQTIRDVVIKIRLEQAGPTKLRAPDTSEIDRATKQTTAAATAAFTAEEREALASYSRIMRERKKMQDDAAKLAENTAKYADGIDPTGGQVLSNRAQRNEQDRQRQSAAELSATKQQIEAYSAIGEGAIRAARGVAFLTAANEDDMRVALQYVAAAQGVLDVFAGTANIVKATITLRQAQTVTTAAAVASETALAGAATTATAATTSQTAATWALNAAMSGNPVVLAGIAVATIAVAAGYTLLKQSTDEAEAAIIRSNGTLNAIGTNFERLAELTQRGSEAIAAAGESFSVAMQRIQLDGQRPFANADDQIRAIEKELIVRKSLLDAASVRGTAGVGVTGAAGVKLQNNQFETTAAQELLSIRQKQTDELQKQRDLAAQALDTSRRTVEAEKDRLRTAEERFGRLSRGEQERLKGIADRQKNGGQLTEQEARFLEQSGFGGANTSAFFQKRGQEGGFGQVAEGLGLNAALEQAKRNLQADTATFGEFITDADELIRDAIRKRDQDFDKLTRLIVEAISLKELIKSIEAEQARQNGNGINKTVGNT